MPEAPQDALHLLQRVLHRKRLAAGDLALEEARLIGERRLALEGFEAGNAIGSGLERVSRNRRLLGER
jgi:hypothetical protein